ncbi:MAG: winged helix-turn-helix domain-containing protein [Hyphomonadaceae bacterium]
MIYGFGDFELDTGRVELRKNGVTCAVEPQVFALLRFLIENRDRMVTKDEIIDAVWEGRIVSDSAVTSRVKSSRQAVGDNGSAQTIIRTVHGRGFAFIADVRVRSDIIVQAASEAPVIAEHPQSRPSIAVLPFRVVGATEPGFPIAEALPYDLIVALSRLRWLFVIARGSSFRFREPDVTIDDVKVALNVEYCLTGMVEIAGKMMSISVELSATSSKGIVWSERFRGPIETVHEIRDRIVNAVTNAVEVRIPFNEAQRALLKSPDNLDAWSAYHLGLHHMYRFNKADNDVATHLFERAVSLEPGFARAHAGLSFTHFQNAFLRYADHGEATKLAQRYANQSLERDPLDPFGHFTMGRVQWLRGDLEASLPWLEQATSLNPNYAQAKYSRGWAEALLGSAGDSQANIATALALSPVDPFVYGMLGVRAMSHIVLDEFPQAAEWSERAANSPGAHALIEMIAVAAHGLNGDDTKALEWAASARTRAAHLGREDFLRAFPFKNADTRARLLKVLGQFGL